MLSGRIFCIKKTTGTAGGYDCKKSNIQQNQGGQNDSQSHPLHPTQPFFEQANTGKGDR
jgi:hypothetical protein